ncbi:hypothetical protein HPB48_008791 [Haemaphysalis longicornis]|uniref:Uncharacterized protein n=1 Tax=Haemaphysalis longicornis TaxID=44386 RepID=A0A9J6H087_HAELO|nr:hypothetical protein HPB48_008791 [Haemaphysalis longicornis]
MACPSEAPCKARPLSSEAPPVQPTRRPSSQPTNSSTNGDMCHPFNDEADAENPLMSPCHCAASCATCTRPACSSGSTPLTPGAANCASSTPSCTQRPSPSTSGGSRRCLQRSRAWFSGPVTFYVGDIMHVL